MAGPKKTYDPGAFWDGKFDGESYRYGKAPNAFVKQALPQVLEEGARVLCVGDGEGRNGVWAARQGFEVTSLEPSAAGIQKIERLARETGVEVETINDRMPSSKVAPKSYDAVVLTYIHVPEEHREPMHRACVEVLGDGGVVVLEAFTPAQRENQRQSGGPPHVDLMYTAELLEADFEGLSFEMLEECTTELEEGTGHRGVADVVRMIARKS